MFILLLRLSLAYICFSFICMRIILVFFFISFSLASLNRKRALPDEGDEDSSMEIEDMDRWPLGESEADQNDRKRLRSVGQRL